MSEMIHQRSNSALSWTGSICSILGLVAVIVLQSFDFNNYSDYTLLLWWLTIAVIAIAATLRIESPCLAARP